MKKCLHDQVVNNNMTANENKGMNQPLLFDAVPIENYIFSLLHAEIGVGNKIVEHHISYGLLREWKIYLRKKLY